MIRLEKEAKPTVLQKNEEKWKNAILAKLKAGEELTKTDKSRYSHRDIKETLVKETDGKCCYCESKIRHISYGDIEHICPKSIRPELWVEWTNLTLACDVCNTNKGTMDVTATNFVDPYQVNPEQKFWFSGPIIMPMPNDEGAILCERKLRLNRDELVDRRIVKIKNLMRHLHLIATARSDELKNVLIEDLKSETTDDKEYAALSRGFLKVAEMNGFVPAQ